MTIDITIKIKNSGIEIQQSNTSAVSANPQRCHKLEWKKLADEKPMEEGFYFICSKQGGLSKFDLAVYSLEEVLCHRPENNYWMKLPDFNLPSDE
jgi:hypothetical protein